MLVSKIPVALFIMKAWLQTSWNKWKHNFSICLGCHISNCTSACDPDFIWWSFIAAFIAFLVIIYLIMDTPGILPFFIRNFFTLSFPVSFLVLVCPFFFFFLWYRNGICAWLQYNGIKATLFSSFIQFMLLLPLIYIYICNGM